MFPANENKFDVEYFRDQFPYFRSAARTICLDGVGGTQVPDGVIKAVSDYFLYTNGNKGGIFPRSVETDKIMDETRQIMAEFINAPGADEIILGPNFTTLTFNMSRALARTWKPGDEIVVSRLDHDANVSPWIAAAEDAGVTVRYLDIDEGTCQLTEENLRKVLSDKTKLVTFCAASSSVGTKPDVKRLTEVAKEAGALVYVDAVAYAPHGPIDVQDWGADFVGCSTYKFFGPHMAFLWGKRDLLESLPAYKIRPAPNTLPLKWLNGAQTYELAAGAKAAIEYIAHIGEKNPAFQERFPHFTGRQLNIHTGMAAIEDHETKLAWKFIEEMKKRPRYTLWGITDEALKDQRVPTIAVSLGDEKSNDIATYLAGKGIDIWSRSVYSISLSERLGLEEKGGFIRVGFIHYNTDEEVETLLKALDDYKPDLRPVPRARNAAALKKDL
jgi:cysteine desulfurase family protein (TIGR01976 family)